MGRVYCSCVIERLKGCYEKKPYLQSHIYVEWPELVGEYKGTPSAEGYTLTDGTPLNLSDKDQKWMGFKDTFKF